MTRLLTERENNAELFERFVRERAPTLKRFLGGLRVRDEDVADVVQESIARLLRYRDQEPPEAWAALLYRIAINVTRDRARRDRHAPIGDSETHIETAAADDSPEQHAIDQQALARVRAAILRLPPRCRAVYLMNRVDGMSYPEIARRCGISVKAVEKHISHALRELRDARERQGTDSP